MSREVKNQPETSIEEWDSFHSNYAVSSLGRIKSLERIDRKGHFRNEMIMKPNISIFGYERVSFFINGKYISKVIHRLVAQSFIPNPENKPEVNHKNGIKTDNRVTNLEWVTKKENSQHAILTGLFTQIGEKAFFSKLANKQVMEIYVSNLTANQLSAQYNVCEGTINKIRGNHQWKQITDNLVKSKTWRNGLKKLTDAQVIEIFKSSQSLRRTAKIYGITYITVSNIRSGKSRSNITGKVHKSKIKNEPSNS